MHFILHALCFPFPSLHSSVLAEPKIHMLNKCLFSNESEIICVLAVTSTQLRCLIYQTHTNPTIIK